jgi:Zn-dependent peptidase ImmA (M78 family)
VSNNAATGARVRAVRLATGVAQSDLAVKLGSQSNGLISKIENGRIAIDDDALIKLAAELNCTPEFLRSPSPDVLATRPWLRAYADASARTVESVMADNLLLHEVVERLHLLRVPDTLPNFRGDPHDDQAIEDFAAEVRAAADIAEGERVGNAMRAAERLGCVVLPLPDELGRHLGLSQRLDGLPYIRVSRAREGVPGDRQRFTVVHELGHLALHSELGPPETAADAKLIEKQAHLFAAAFLTPADPLLDHWRQLGGRVTLSTLQDLKAHWGVAIKSLVFRFKQLGIVDAHQSTALYKQISKRGWNTAEPVPVSNEEPVWLRRALTKRFGTADVDDSTIAMVTTQLGLGRSHLSRWTTWGVPTNPASLGDVIDLVPRDSSKQAGSDEGVVGGASITHLRPPAG